MGILRKHNQSRLWFSSILVAVFVTLLFNGCSGIEPYDPPDYREEPPVHGLLTGEEGEFVIYQKVDEPQTSSGTGKGADETAEGEQQ